MSVIVRRSRVKIGATIDPELAAVVDAHVASHPGTDRSAVLDQALRLWHERQLADAMEVQIREDAGRYAEERRTWRGVRTASAKRVFGRSR